MTEQTLKQNGKYLYAVMINAKDQIYGPFGINDSSVYTVSDGQVAAVVSDVPNKKIRPERRHLAAHQKVIRTLMEDSTILPMAFGIIADNIEAIRNILSLNQKAFIEQLLRVESKVEMGLHINWDVPNIFEYFVDTHPQLRAARDRFFGSHNNPSQDNKLELGRMFERILQEDRETHIATVRRVLSPHCVEIKHNPPRSEQEVVTFACLVERDEQDSFEAGVFEAANLFDDNFAFDYNGPWAPHNFVELNLQI